MLALPDPCARQRPPSPQAFGRSGGGGVRSPVSCCSPRPLTASFSARRADGNLYYAAAVRSMLTNWHAFFFAAFDPGGFVTVDKPPLGFWLQAASARLLGFSGGSLLLPQALAGVLSVAVLFALLRRAFGTPAGCSRGCSWRSRR